MFMRYGTNAVRLHRRDSHWNLEAFGIVPEAQGWVPSTRLLVHGLARADQDGLHCYLTTQPDVSATIHRPDWRLICRDGSSLVSRVASSRRLMQAGQGVPVPLV
jgi:hypothetical protein